MKYYREEYLKPVIVAALLGVLTIVCMYVTFITDAPTEKTDSQIMQSRIEGTLMSGDYTYVVDGTELATLDNMTVATRYCIPPEYLYDKGLVMDSLRTREWWVLQPITLTGK